jgi:hypothetical protein
MSLDIFFDKRFTLNDVKNKTTLEVKFVNDKYWIEKGNSVVLVCQSDNIEYSGLDNIVYEITSYGLNDMKDIMNEIILTFQTMFVTDNEMEFLWRHAEMNQDDIYKIYKITTERYGYFVDENNIISKKV